jgi:hypothetical protein
MRASGVRDLLARRPDGIFVAPFEQGEIEPDSIPGSLPDGARGAGVEAPRPSVSGWTVEVLGEDQEPGASGDGPGDGINLLEAARVLAAQQWLRVSYIPPKTYVFFSLRVHLAQLLHCLMETVACPMAPCADADSLTPKESSARFGKLHALRHNFPVRHSRVGRIGGLHCVVARFCNLLYAIDDPASDSCNLQQRRLPCLCILRQPLPNSDTAFSAFAT